MYLRGLKPRTHTRNVGAELNGLLLGLAYVPANTRAYVVCDYLGCSAWMIGRHRMNDEEVVGKVEKAVDFVLDRRNVIRFVHHGGHQTDPSPMTVWNWEADRLCSQKYEVVGGEWIPWGDVEVVKAKLDDADRAARKIICTASGDKKARPSHWVVVSKPKYHQQYASVNTKTGFVTSCEFDSIMDWEYNPRQNRIVILKHVGKKKR